MNSSLLEFCNLIANEGVKYALQHKKIFLEIVNKTTNTIMSDKQTVTIFTIFSFLNWAYANGVWSNLSNTDLRRDLMEQSLKSIVLKTAHELAQDKSTYGVAFFAVGLEQVFRKFVQTYTERIKEFEKEGIEPDANTATLCGLEWIQGYLGLSDFDMNIIVPKFNNRIGDVARIEGIAWQVNRATVQRK